MSDAKQLIRPTVAYDADFYGWAREQARALRAARPNSVDWAKVAEEMDSLGNSEESEIESRLNVLLVHLLKWRAQPAKRKTGWQATIIEQRHRLARRLRRSPSLASYPEQIVAEEYTAARKVAAVETRLSEKSFPRVCPFTIEQILDENYWPESAA